MELASVGMNARNQMFSVQEKGMTASQVNPQQQDTTGQNKISATVQKTVTYSPEGVTSAIQGDENARGFERIF